jgi:hypothetical protein
MTPVIQPDSDRAPNANDHKNILVAIKEIQDFLATLENIEKLNGIDGGNFENLINNKLKPVIEITDGLGSRIKTLDGTIKDIARQVSEFSKTIVDLGEAIVKNGNKIDIIDEKIIKVAKDMQAFSEHFTARADLLEKTPPVTNTVRVNEYAQDTAVVKDTFTLPAKGIKRLLGSGTIVFEGSTEPTVIDLLGTFICNGRRVNGGRIINDGTGFQWRA